MSSAVVEIYLFAASVVCLALSLVVGMWKAHRLPRLGPGRGAAEQGLAILALLCVVAGLVQPVAGQGGWPLTAPAEVIIASAAAAISWQLLDQRHHESRLEGLLLCTIAVALLIWGVARGAKTRSAAPVTAFTQQSWRFASHLALAVASGAFLKAASCALACLMMEKRTDQQGQAVSAERRTCRAMLPGLAMLTGSLLLTSLGGQYMGGAYWSWGASESWQLLVWLFYTILWFAMVLLEWRTPRACSLTAAGLILTLLMLNAVGG